MKRLLFLFLMVSFCSQAQVASHPIGVMTIELEPYKLYFLGMPFDNTNTYENIVAQLPPGSTFSTWDKSAFRYATQKVKEDKLDGQDVKRGDGFFISVSELIYLRVYGLVPDSTNFIKKLERGFNMCSLPYPVETNISNDALMDNLESGSIIIRWDNDEQRYNIASKKKDKWSQDEIIITPEQGFWINQKTRRLVWSTSKPYHYP